MPHAKFHKSSIKNVVRTNYLKLDHRLCCLSGFYVYIFSNISNCFGVSFNPSYTRGRGGGGGGGELG